MTRMKLFDGIINHKEKIAVIGLGYVGLPLAVSFAKRAAVIGFDINTDKIKCYKNGIDVTKEVGDEALKGTTLQFTDNPNRIKEAKFIIITVPTPINADKTPDLSPIIEASQLVGKNLTEGAVVVYESTVYPGVTEDICIPILEEHSGLKCEIDFKVGYSPERINPGDRVHRLENIKKVVAAIDEEALEEVAKIYELIIEAGVHRVSTIKVAEATKVVENSQRDINIAFMNELSMVFNRMHIDTFEVVEAMNTKWNALGFYPGLVGGHCIGVDPYYFIYKAEKLGYHSQIILSGRQINDNMPSFVVENLIKKLIVTGKRVKDAKIVIFGITFKENCNDLRNSKIENVVKLLKEYEIEPVLVDPQANKEEAAKIYGKELTDMSAVTDADCVVFAVGHNEFKDLSFQEIDAMYKNIPNEEKIIMDLRHIFNKQAFQDNRYNYWSL